MIRDGVRRVLRLALRRRDRWEREVEEEIKLHLALRAEQLMARGDDADAAYAEAVRRFGPLHESRARLLDEARHREVRMQRSEWVADLRQDLTFAWRGLRRQKAWTAITVLTLALGIGATTAVFSVVSTLLLHPLPFPGADRIVLVYQQPTSGNNTGISVTITPSPMVVREWRANARTFEDIQPARITMRELRTVSGDPSAVMTGSVLPSFATFAGQQLITGRFFTANDVDAHAPVAVVGEGFWRERLGADPAVLGKTLTVGDTAYTIIGVAPATLRFGAPGRRATDLWLPLDLHAKFSSSGVMARLRPGVSLDAARAELDSIAARSNGGKAPFVAVVQRPGERVSFHDSLILLAAAVALVLLVACSNVAHLLIARTAARNRELSIRRALGAGHGRIFRQLLTESGIVAAAGTAAGVLVGWLALRLLIAARPSSLDELTGARVDGYTLWLTIGIAAVSGILFGTIGVFQSARQSTNEALKAGSLSVANGGRRRGRRVLVISEMALSAVLIIGATLAIRSLQRLTAADVGFETRGLYTLYPAFGPALQDSATQRRFLAQLAADARRAPGVTGATIAQAPPGTRSFSVGRLEIEGEAAPSEGAMSFIDVNSVAPNFFRTMGVSFVEGTTFSDTTSTTRQVVINAGFARKHWPTGSTIGRRVRIAGTKDESWLTIVGVVRDAQFSGPGAESNAPLLYFPPSGEMSAVIVRTTRDARTLAPLTKTARDLGARSLSIDGVEQLMHKVLAQPRFVMLLLTGFSVLGLLLATIGLYGVMAFAVAQESREIGIRLALGASRRSLVGRVLSRGLSLAVVGAAVGIGIATWATKLIASQLYGVERLDTVSFVCGGLALLFAAAIACIVPARRALAVDPMTAIRAD